MNSKKLFDSEFNSLENLSEKPDIFWYVSAGSDFRGPVFLTDQHIRHLSQFNGRIFKKPELFVYNCIGNETNELKKRLQTDKCLVLLDDGLTKIKASNYTELTIKESVLNELSISKSHIDQIPDDVQIGAFYFELSIDGDSYSEVQKILYFEHENIDFFNKIILKDFFHVTYLCTTREGMGMGNCLKSMIDYIYKDNHPNFFSDQGFKPDYIVSFNDFTKELLENQTSASQCLILKKYWDQYPPEERAQKSNGYYHFQDSVVYKLTYM